MKVMPIHPEIEIEHVPPDSLSRVRDHRRGVTHEGAAVETERRQVVATTFDDAVLAGAVVRPRDLSTGANGHVRRVEGEVDDRDGCGARAADLYSHRAAHRCAVDAADVLVN